MESGGIKHMAYSYKCYSETKDVMKKYVNATELCLRIIFLYNSCKETGLYHFL